MKSNMHISVIIPVYNAEKYVKRAVESALCQPECREVVLVEDSSPDNALRVCQELSKKHRRVVLFQHEDRNNHGPGPSRNLGIQKASHSLIAFLDADDFYLPGRFTETVNILTSDPSIDGVYEAVGCEFENEEARKRYFTSHSTEVAIVKRRVEPEKLFYYLISGKHGYIHPDGLVIKKGALIKAGMYPELRLHEDTMLFFKLAALSRLSSGQSGRPVALRYLHLENTITRPGIDFSETRLLMYDHLLSWMKNRKVDRSFTNLVQAKYFRMRYKFLKKSRNYLSAVIYYAVYKLLFKKKEDVYRNLD